MRRITASVISIFVAWPAVASARLPVVNVAAGSVSARAAFGDVDTRPVAPTPAVVAAPMPAPAKTVVARAAKKRTTAPVAKPAADSGEKIAAADVLMPRRPSSDLWAHSDSPLRMPDRSEISVVRADYELPEESLEPVPREKVAARATAPLPSATDMGDMDAQIARLIELQRRADESVRTTVPRPAVAAAPEIVETPLPPTTQTAQPRPSLIASPIVADATAQAAQNVAETPVKLSRLVVPMSDEVVVRAVEKNVSPRITAVRDDMTKMSPSELRKAFRKTYLSENRHLSTYQIDDRFDVASDMSAGIEGFSSARDLSEAGGVRPLEIKIKFRGDDAALSRENYNLLNEYAGIVVSNPKRAIQVSIPTRATTNLDDRRLAARRLAIVEQVLRDTGVSEQRIMPVLSQRDEDGFVLRIISSDQYETLTQQKRNIFGDTVGKKTYKSMSW